MNSLLVMKSRNCWTHPGLSSKREARDDSKYIFIWFNSFFFSFNSHLLDIKDPCEPKDVAAVTEMLDKTEQHKRSLRTIKRRHEEEIMDLKAGYVEELLNEEQKYEEHQRAFIGVKVSEPSKKKQRVSMST